MYSFLKDKSSRRSTNTYPSSSSIFEKDKKPKYNISSADLFVNNNQEPILLMITETKGRESETEYMVRFLELKTEKEKAATKLDITKIDDYEIRTFSNGNIYFILNERILYRVNMTNMTVDNITESMFSEQTLLSAGLVSIKFVRTSWGSGFNVITNLGNYYYYYYYYPIVNEVYTKFWNCDLYSDKLKGLILSYYKNLLIMCRGVKYSNKFKLDGYQAFQGQGIRLPKNEQQAELKQLKKELAETKLERGILKKVLSIFSKNDQ